ncbi:MAG: AAA family ATPase [Syntrophus sp. (in: bacteria)]
MDSKSVDEIRAAVEERKTAEQELMEERAAIQEEGGATQHGHGAFPVLKNASQWIQEPPRDPDQILADTFDRGDKIVLIGSSKSRKTFFLLQMLVSIAAGLLFMGWHTPQRRTLLHIQLEIQEHHFHRRLISVCRSLGVSPADLGDRLLILNARGMGLSGRQGIEKIRLYADKIKPDLISIDPLYKILTGDENSNSNDGMKGTLDMFDSLAKQTGASVLYVHHDRKGVPGDHAITDRGAGGGVLARDYDASIVMTPHATEEDAFVIETSLRNYRPQEPFTVLWTENEETGGYCFEERLDILATKKTSKASKTVPALDTYLPEAAEILGHDEMKAAEFRQLFKEKTGLGDKKIRGFMAFATAGGNPHITERSDLQAKNIKWIRFRGID